MSEYLRGSGQSLLGKKVLLCGLSEAGKTAIRSVVFGGKEAIEVRNLGATLNYVRQFISLGDRQVTLMDLGGQRIFLDRFISKFSPFVFHNVATLLFVVDTFDSQRFDSSNHYFKAALDRLNKYSPNALTFILLHKMDLIVDDPNKDKLLEYLRTLFQQDIDQELTFYETTIYNETIKEALHEVLEISFPEIYDRRSTQPSVPPPAAASPVPTVKPSPPTPRKTTHPISPTRPITPKDPQPDASPTPSRSPSVPPEPTPDLPLSAITRAFAFVEDPNKIPLASSEEITPSSSESVEESYDSDYGDIAKAFRFVDTGELPSEFLDETTEDVTGTEVITSEPEPSKGIDVDVEGAEEFEDVTPTPGAPREILEEIETTEIASPIESLYESSEVTETEEVILSTDPLDEAVDLSEPSTIVEEFEGSREDESLADVDHSQPLSDKELDELIFSVDDLLPTPQSIEAEDSVADTDAGIQPSELMTEAEAAVMEIKEEILQPKTIEEMARGIVDSEQDSLPVESTKDLIETTTDTEEYISSLDLVEKDITLPETRFDIHPTLDEDFDIFEAAEEVVRFLEATRNLFKLSFIAIKMRDAESLVHVGSLEKFDEFANQGLEHVESQRRPDQPPSPFIMTENDLFILGEPIGAALMMIVIGSSISGAEILLLSKMSEFKQQVTKMVEITFSEMF